MRTDLNLSSLTLAKRELQRIDGGKGVRVQCLRGDLWLTQDGDPRDIILEPGDEFEFDSDATSYLSALSDASYLLLREKVPFVPAAQSAPTPKARSWAQWWSGA